MEEEPRIKYTLEISEGLKKILDDIKNLYKEKSEGAIKLSYYEASNILAMKIDKIGGIKSDIKIL